MVITEAKSEITTAITKAQTEIVNEIRSLGNIFQTSFESFSKSIQDIIVSRYQINEYDKNTEMKPDKNFKQEIKKEETKAFFNAKEEKFKFRHNDFIYNTDSAKKKLKYHEKEKLISKRKLFNDTNLSENGKDIKPYNVSLNISFSNQSDSQKDKSHDIEIKNANVVVPNSIRRKYIRKKQNF